MEEKTPDETTSVEVSRSFAMSANGENVKVSNSGVGVVSAGNEASLRQGGAGVVAGGRSVQVMQGGAQIMAAGSEMRVMQGGGQLMVSGGYMRVEQGGGLVMVATRASVRRSYVGVLISGSTQLQGGARVLLGTPQAAAFGAALGLVFALASKLLKGRR
ncbi:MAG: hypothetical protein M3437_13335 [Chloroflexota bacterium]|nr:hypothetical protein [Chloroflexota bacterium]MDQ5866026.1 hypothetical protein [Chloroflexota bacterium]